MFPPKPLRQTDLLTLGDARISRITDMDPFALPLTFLFPGAVPEALEAHRSSLAPWHVDFAAGSVLLGVHSLLLQAGGLNILIDTCVGACKPRPARPEWHQRRAAGYLAALSRAGLAPEDIDIVLCTHLHADHVGWNTRLQDGRWVPTFPRARYVIGRQELQDAASAHQAGHNHGAYADSVLPVIEAGLVQPVDGGAELQRGMTLTPLPGHTAGQLGLALSVAGRRVLFCGDALHSPVQVHHPDWSSRFCADPAQAARTRRTLLETVAEDAALLVPAHLRGDLALSVRRQGDAFHPAPA